MKILVTGASGYIGAHVCAELHSRGHMVTGWDNEFYGEHNHIQDVTEHRYYVKNVLSDDLKGNFDAVVHLAGRSNVPDSMSDPADYYNVNIMGTSNLLDRVTTPHFIFASTSSAFEMASPYAKSKVCAEDVIKQKAKGYTIFRFFNVSGSNGRYRQLGEATHLIRVAAKVATGQLDALTVYGTDYPTPDGTCIRDYVHVVDLANAIANAAERGPANTEYECLGSNTGYSVYDVINAFERATNIRLPVRQGPRRGGDAVASVVDNLSDLITLEKTIEDMCLDQYNLELELMKRKT